MKNETISIETLKLLVNQLKEKKDQIDSIYKIQVKDTLLSGRINLKIDYSKYDEIENKINQSFLVFDEEILELIEVLNNKIIPGYENLSDDIIHLFNQKFAKEISSLLDIKGE